MPPTDEEFALVRVLRIAVRDSGMKLRDLGEMAGVSQSQISRFMNGKTLTLVSAAKLFKHFKMKALFGDQTFSDTEAESAPNPPPAPSTARKTKRPRKK